MAGGNCSWHAAIHPPRLWLQLVNSPRQETWVGASGSLLTAGAAKDGTKTAHVGRQWLGRCGKIDNGVVVTLGGRHRRRELTGVGPRLH